MNAYRAELIAASRELQDVNLVNQLSKQDIQRRLQSSYKNSGITSVTAADVDAIARGVDYKSAQQVKTALRQAAAWLKSEVGRKQYVVLVELDDSFGIKSTMWLAHQAAREIGRWPVGVVPTDPQYIQRAFDLGIRTFVYFDDATYSGTQIEEHVDLLSSALKAAPANRPVHVLIAVGFSSEKAREKIANAVFRAPAGVQFKLFSAGTMPTVRDVVAKMPNAQRERVGQFLKRDLNMPFSIMAHKIPDHFSFPRIISRWLERDDRFEPPYKAVSSYVRPVASYTKGNLRYFVTKHNSGGYVHTAFANKNGVLTPVLTTLEPTMQQRGNR